MGHQHQFLLDDYAVHPYFLYTHTRYRQSLLTFIGKESQRLEWKTLISVHQKTRYDKF